MQERGRWVLFRGQGATGAASWWLKVPDHKIALQDSGNAECEEHLAEKMRGHHLFPTRFLQAQVSMQALPNFIAFLWFYFLLCTMGRRR